VINKVSFYCYLFSKPFDRIIRYDVLWKDGDKFLLKHTQLDRDYTNRTQQIVVTVYDSLHDAIAGIIIRLRNLEVEARVYKKLKITDDLDASYEQLIHELEEAARENHLKSFSLFGHICKFRPQTAAKNFLKSMGYFVLTTKRPHIYILDDFIKKEEQNILHRK
jgi:hypothetical protein